MYEGTPCQPIVAIIDIVHHIDIIASSSPSIVNKCHIANNMLGLITCPCNNCMFFSLCIDADLNNSMILTCCLLFCLLFYSDIFILCVYLLWDFVISVLHFGNFFFVNCFSMSITITITIISSTGKRLMSYAIA